MQDLLGINCCKRGIFESKQFVAECRTGGRLDSVIVVNDARVVTREDKKTILLPDFSQKIIEHRHMDDGTVDVFTRHVHNDGTCTYFEQLGVAESELALGPDGPCSSDQYKAGSTYPSRPTKPNGLGSGGNHDSGAPHHPNDQHDENMKRKRLNKLVIHMATECDEVITLRTTITIHTRNKLTFTK